MAGSAADKGRAASKRNETDRACACRVSKFLILMPAVAYKSWTNRVGLCVNTNFARLVQTTERSNTDGDSASICFANGID